MRLWYIDGAWASRKAKAIVAGLQPEAIRRIAVIRHGALGDMVMVRPLLVELRKHFPNAELTLSLVSHYSYAAPIELVDRVHSVHGKDQRHVSAREQFKRMRELGPQDILFDCANTSRGYWLTLLTSAKLKVGYPYRAWQRRLFYDVAVWRSDFTFEADNMLHMLQIFGLKTRHPPSPCIPGEPRKQPRPYLVYFPTASIVSKCWPEKNFAELIERMAVGYPQYDHIVMQGVAKWETIEPIMHQLTKYSNVVGVKPGPLEECIGWVKGAQLIVANDTGVRNLAIVAGIPTVGILFSTYVPYRYWPAYGKHDVVFDAAGSVPTVEAVTAATIAMLQRVTPSAG